MAFEGALLISNCGELVVHQRLTSYRMVSKQLMSQVADGIDSLEVPEALRPMWKLVGRRLSFW